MKQDKMISVIVPTYNSERYIEKCITSLINQTYKNIEILVIDNNSKDSTRDIVKRFQNKDSRIILIKNEKTFFVGYSRNVGLNNAKGDYISFMDSDDFAEPKFMETMLSKFEENPECNIVQCCFNTFNNFGDFNDLLPYNEDKIFSGRELCIMMTDFIGLCTPNVVLWSKIYKASVFENFRFYENSGYEDMSLTYKLLYNEEKILWIKDRLINLRKHFSSETSVNSYCIDSKGEILAYMDRIVFYKEKQDDELYKLSLKRLYYIVTQHLYLSNKMLKKNEKRIKNIVFFKNIIKSTYPKLKELKWPVRTRLRMWFIYHFPMTFGKISLNHKLDFKK